MSRKPLWSFFLALAVAGLIESHAAVPGRRIFAESLAPLSQTADPRRPHVSRTTLSVGERAAAIDLVISLAMRNYAEFEARISSGGRISQAEMEEKYLPDRADHDRIRDWALSQGFTQSLVDSNHTNLFVRGTVDQAAAVFQVKFARIATAEGEFTSAISAPSLPAEIATPVLNIAGLQQHIRAHPRGSAAALVQSVAGYATPADVAAAYNIPANLTGSGQTIAIYGWSTLSLSDLSAFWNATGSTQKISNVTVVNGTAGSTATDTSYFSETTMDTQWAGAIASGAKLRIYNQDNAGYLTAVMAAATQVLADAKTDLSISVLSYSYAGPEGDYSGATLRSSSQTFGQLAAAGISVLAGSGDGGSNPRTDGILGYLATEPQDPEYPASDPNVTGVGGTSLTFDNNWIKTSEAVWLEVRPDAIYASGGGTSSAFLRPPWQNIGVSTILSGASNRCIPDVAACSVWGAGPYGFYGIFNGNIYGSSGTSLSTPVFGGITALINQARSAAGHGLVGLLNPWLYPLAGTSSFNAITSGNNGAYSAGPIYNLCTGLGSPNVTNLISALAGGGSTLSNMSVRTNLGSAQSLVVGFVTTGPKSLLVRAVGPGLNSVFGLTGYYADPNFSLVSQGVTIDQNDDWNASLASTFTRLGAFPLVAGSKDAALLRTINGATTAQVGGNGSGVMLVELYDADAAGFTNRLTNVSARNQVGTGSDILISGFVIAGLLPRPLLIRGIGPGLHDVFGISGTLADPILEIHQTVNGVDTIVASNDNWDSSLTAVFDRVGAYHLTPGSKDAALSITLPPGVYTAQLYGANSGTGDGVVEIYEVP